MSRIFMRPERDNNWYYESAGQPRKSMRKEGVPAGKGGQLAAEMLQNKWDHEAFYSRNGLVNPNKKWLELKEEYFEFCSPPTFAELSFVKLKIAVKYFEAVLWPTEKELNAAMVLPISKELVMKWRKARLLKNLGQSVEAEEGYLRPMLRWAKDGGFLKEDPFSKMPAIRYSVTEKDPLTVPQANAFLDLLGKKYPHYAILGLMAYESGMRVDELVHLRIEDVNFMTGIAQLLPHETFCDCFQCGKQKKPGWLGKHGVPRKIPLSPKANAMILQLFQERKRGNVFPWKSQSIIRVVARILKLMGIYKTRRATHVFRHTFATHCDQAGVRQSMTARILGHANKTTTDGYTHAGGVGDEELQRQYQQLLDWRSGHQEGQISAVQ